MSLGSFVVALVHEEDGTFGISFPDFPGCVSGGSTVDEAIRRGQAALAFHVEGMIADGDPLPVLRSLAELRRDPDFVEDSKDAGIVFVPFDLPGKAVRLNISIEEHLLEAIDREAEARRESRSAFLANAAKERLKANA